MPSAMATSTLSCKSLTSGVGTCGIAIEVDHKGKFEGKALGGCQAKEGQED